MAFEKETTKIHTLKSGMIADKVIIIILSLGLILAVIWMFVMLCKKDDQLVTTMAVTTTPMGTTKKKKDLADLAVRLAR